MKLRKENILLDVALGAGLYLLDSLRDRVADNVTDLRGRARDKYGDLRDQARDTYETVSDRVGRASDVIRGEDHSGLSTTVALLLGLGVGVGVGMLLAPASGEETRTNIADKVREGFNRTREAAASGTYGV